MMEYRCTECGVLSYSASTAKKVGACPGCMKPLTKEDDARVFDQSLVDAVPVMTFAKGVED